MDLQEINLNILKLLSPYNVNHIGITGGEPTLAEESLFMVINLCKKRFPKASISLLTNGKKFGDFDFTRRIVELGHEGLIYCVSLYSDIDTQHDEIVGAYGSFRETVKGIHNLALFKQLIEIRIVIFKENYRRLLPFAQFIYRNFPFVSHVAFMGMECTGMAERNLDRVWIDPIEYKLELKSAVLYLHQRAINVSIYNIPLCLIPREIWRFSKKAISEWKNIYIDECKKCKMQTMCGGLFSTSVKQSGHIVAIN